MIVIDDLSALFSYGANRRAAPQPSEQSGINQLDVIGRGGVCVFVYGSVGGGGGVRVLLDACLGKR